MNLQDFMHKLSDGFTVFLLSVSSSVSDSGSSQGLSQPSTQTTQYLRADTPNNAAPVTSKKFYRPKDSQSRGTNPSSGPILENL